ncbi:hypothetical protein [Plantactinospora sp. GCM10030261]|uniref:hypothetical protein n=1 Tax=Plantactinospora sp. GCM10030261 TaxID=3273420 RepID=UPI00361D678D
MSDETTAATGRPDSGPVPTVPRQAPGGDPSEPVTDPVPTESAPRPTAPDARTTTTDIVQLAAGIDPAAPPDHFGGIPHFATSPLPDLDPTGAVIAGTGLRKFVDALPGLGAEHRNGLGNYLPVAVPDTITYPGCDYYEIGVQEYTQQLHRDLRPTRLRGYRQLNNGTDGSGHNTVPPPARPYHLGPVLVAHRDRPVRVKLVNQLPTGPAGDLFLPVDTTVAGAGIGPLNSTDRYPHNRTVLHLAGADGPWISAGSAHQWFTPAGEVTPYARGAGFATVPDMPDPAPGAVTLFFPNQQSGRMLWFHDLTAGLARLTVYSGLLGVCLLDDPAERQLVADGVLPAEQIPLVIEDKTFVPELRQLATQDPTWDTAAWGGPGSLWFPHVYLPNQNPYHPSGRNPAGRWDYGPWYGSPPTDSMHGSVPNPHHGRPDRPTEPPRQPGTPVPSAPPTAFLDTPLVNGCAYPYLRIQPKAYRFRILNACLDRTVNLQLYHAASSAPMWRPDGAIEDAAAGEVPMVPACPHPDLPPDWPTDGRAGGVPDPRAAGPDWLQIGTDGGLLPRLVVLPSRPIGYRYDRRDVTVLNVAEHSLLLGPGERADVVVDFSSVPPGSTLILYNDAPAPLPAFDPRYDHYTDGPDQTDRGGAPPTRPGYGPNTRTLLQFRVAGAPGAPVDLVRLRERLPRAYASSQPPPLVPQPAYDQVFGTRTESAGRLPVHAPDLVIDRGVGGPPLTLPAVDKVIVDGFEPGYGRQADRFGADPGVPTEVLVPSAGPAGGDVQLWRVRQLGRQGRTVRFPGPVQVVNRVARDGAIRAPHPTELGWKQVVRVNPGEDTVVALRPRVPDPLPFRVADSIRLLDPTLPPGEQLPGGIRNLGRDFGWEYHWYADLPGGPGTDLLRPVVLQVSPARPTGLTATGAPGGPTMLPAIVLAWTNNAGATPAAGFSFDRATDPGFTEDRCTVRISAAHRGHTDHGVVPGVTYYYRVRAENAVSYSPWSNTAAAVVHLPAATGLAAMVPPTPPLRIGLTWTGQSFATGVEVQRATNPTFTAGLVTVPRPASNTHTDVTISPDTTYYWRVRATYRGAAAPWSNVATVRTPAPPAPPVDVTARATGSGPVELTWRTSPVSVVTGLLLQRATDAAFTSALVTVALPGNARKHLDAAVDQGSTYHYRIQTVNAAGGSPFAGPVAVRA